MMFTASCYHVSSACSCNMGHCQRATKRSRGIRVFVRDIRANDAPYRRSRKMRDMIAFVFENFLLTFKQGQSGA